MPDDEDEFNQGPTLGDEDYFRSRDFQWGAKEPHALLYGFSSVGHRLNMLGGYRYDPSENWVSGRKEFREWTIPHRWPGTVTSRDNQEDLLFHTFAPLAGVTAVQMFYSRRVVPREREPFCSGIIFHYEDGGSKVVGEVRLLNDRASIAGETITNPKLVCLETPRETSTSQRIHFLTETDDIEEGVHSFNPYNARTKCNRFPLVQDITCYPMEGTIDWWFSASERMRVEIWKPRQLDGSLDELQEEELMSSEEAADT